MLKLKTILIITAFLLPVLMLGAECSKISVVKVEKLEGSAKVSADQQNWSPLKSGMEIDAKKFVKTETKSNLFLLFPDGSSMKVGENSLINLQDILSSQQCEREDYKVKVFFGKVWSNVKKLVTSKGGGGENFTVESKNAVAGVRGTSFGFVVNPDESGSVMVFDGSVEVKGEKSKQEEKKPLDIQKWKKNRSRQEVAGPTEISKQEWDSIVVESMQMVKFSTDGKLSKPVPIGKQNADAWYNENAVAK